MDANDANVEKIVASEEFNPPSLVDYLSGKVIATATVFSTMGVTTAYVNARMSMATAFYSYFLAGSIASSSYFGTAYAVRYLRKDQSDDRLNYAVSGALHGGLYGCVRFGLKKSLVGTLLGFGLGAATYEIGKAAYAYSRVNYINYRRMMIHESFVRVPVIIPFQFSTERKVVGFPKESETKSEEQSDVDDNNKAQ